MPPHARPKSAALCAALLLTLGCGSPVGNTPAPGADWTHKELLAHLKANGLEFEVTGRSPGGGMAPPSVTISVSDAYRTYADAVRTATGGGEAYDARITLLPSERQAKEQAGALGDRGFRRGRFLFRGYNADALAVIRKAAEGTLRPADLDALRRRRQELAEKP